MTEPCDVFLHIGTMKSGTSYIQAVMRRNEDALLADGLLGKARLMAAMGDARGRTGRKWPREFRGEWPKLLAELADWPGTSALLSQEFLAAATEEEAGRVVEGLSAHRITVVITARDLLRIVPSHWQTTVRSNSTVAFDDFANAVIGHPDAAKDAQKLAQTFWRSHDLARIVRTWSSVAGAANVVIVTIPPSGGSADALWERFAAAVGLDPDAYDASPDVNSNVSLSYSQAELLRQVNIHLAGKISDLEYRVLVWRFLATKLLQKSAPPDEIPDRPRATAAQQEALVELSRAGLAEVASSGVRVIGDLADLQVPAPASTTVTETPPPANPVPEFAAFVIARLLMRIADQERPDLSPDENAVSAKARRKRKKRRRREAAEAEVEVDLG